MENQSNEKTKVQKLYNEKKSEINQTKTNDAVWLYSEYDGTRFKPYDINDSKNIGGRLCQLK